MKLKMLVILVIASHFARVAKGKTRMIIRTTIISKLRMSHTFITIHTNLDCNLSSIAHSHFAELTSSNESLNVNELFNKHEIFMKNIQEIIQDSIIKALTIRNKKEKNENFVIDLSMILIIEECFVNINIIFSYSSSLIS